MQESRPTPPKTAAKIFFALFTAAAVLAVGYLAVQTYTILHRTYKTETAIAATMSDSITVKGAAVFDLVEASGGGDLGYLVDDGERVSEGTVLAERYTDDSQGVLRERLDRLDGAISLLSKSENSSGSDLTVLTTQTRTALYDLLEQLASDSYSEASGAAEDFLLAQNKLQISTGQADGFADVLAGLQSERDAAAAQLSGLETVTASTNGYFVSAQSTTPAAGDPAALDAMTPSELQAFLDANECRASDALAGYIVTGFSWRFYAILTVDEAARLAGVSSVGISIPGKQNEALTATVEELTTDEETGTAKLVLECRTINADILRLNYENAKIDLYTYKGIRIDKDALHIVDGQKGVYVKYGDLQRFRRITILYEDENYILVPEGGAVGTENEVRLYDEVIVEGTSLQDGKLL